MKVKNPKFLWIVYIHSPISALITGKAPFHCLFWYNSVQLTIPNINNVTFTNKVPKTFPFSALGASSERKHYSTTKKSNPKNTQKLVNSGPSFIGINSVKWIKHCSIWLHIINLTVKNMTKWLINTLMVINFIWSGLLQSFLTLNTQTLCNITSYNQLSHL